VTSDGVPILIFRKLFILHFSLPRRFPDSGEQAVIRQFAEADAAQLELADEIPGPAAPHAPADQPGAVLGLLLAPRNGGCLWHISEAFSF
jgi:hypothetical protein